MLRLGRLDKALRVTWSHILLDSINGNPLVSNGKAIHSPLFYLWRVDESGRHYLVGTYERFGHKEVAKLERDVARFYSPEKIIRLIAEASELRMLRNRMAYRNKHNDILSENRSRIRDLLSDNKLGLRSPNAYSYKYQGTRRTPDPVASDDKQDGWVLPT